METIKGLSKLLQQFESIKDIKYSDALLGAAYILQAESMRNAPVITGFLRQSASSSVTGDKSAQMEFAAEYAFYVEFGTTKRAANPYVRPAIESKTGEMLEYIKDNLSKQIEKEAK